LNRTGYVLYKNANAFDIFNGGMIVMDEEIFSGDKKEKKDQKTIKQVQKTAKKVDIKSAVK
jgi:hypothetical protein